MNQMTTYIFIITGLSILFYILGLSNNPIISVILSPQSMNTAKWVVVIAFLTAASGGIILGLTMRNPEIIAMTGIVGLLATDMWTLTEIFIIVAAFNYILAILIFGPIMYYMVFLLVDYWRGRD